MFLIGLNFFLFLELFFIEIVYVYLFGIGFLIFLLFIVFFVVFCLIFICNVNEFFFLLKIVNLWDNVFWFLGRFLFIVVLFVWILLIVDFIGIWIGFGCEEKFIFWVFVFILYFSIYWLFVFVI